MQTHALTRGLDRDSSRRLTPWRQALAAASVLTAVAVLCHPSEARAAGELTQPASATACVAEVAMCTDGAGLEGAAQLIHSTEGTRR